MDESGQCHTLEVTGSGERVDRYVADRIGDLSRTAVQRLVADGRLTVNGRTVTPSSRLRTGDRIDVYVPAPKPVDLMPEPIALDIVYEDSALLVINKPAGMVVHPGAGHGSGTLVNAVLAHCSDLGGVGGDLRPGIVHRLDKDTSGLIVVAKDDVALHGLQRQFKRRTVSKVYAALVVGFLAQADGLIEAPIARNPSARQQMAVLAAGKAASTRWRVVQRYRDTSGNRFTLVDVHLMTGRTHQIRVHMAWIGYPLVGDSVYGRAKSLAARQFLHARELAFEHPISGVLCKFTAPLPEDLTDVLDRLEVDG
ncbi:MAG: RluA family pseudouridine synthase [Anaerolineae bacterium]|nr:RluA family pseudouridine synthase [Anaerolineae bacterium]